MARFDLFQNEGGAGYLLDVQSDLLGGLNTWVAVHRSELTRLAKGVVMKRARSAISEVRCS